MAFDLHTQFHETWLGMVQPVEGLVVSIPVLVEAQTMVRHGPELQERFQKLCPLIDAETGLAIVDDDKERSKRQRAELAKKKLGATRRYRDLGELLEQLLGWTPDLYDRGDALPANLSRYIAEGHQTIRPTLALRKLADDEAPEVRAVTPATESAEDAEPEDGEPETDDDGDAEDGDDEADNSAARPTGRALTAMPDIETPESLAGKPYVALVWELPTGLDLDKPETVTGDWRYPPASKFDRLLRACRVPVGLLTNGEVIRLVYAPHGEASGSITFDLTDMGDVGGRPILDAFVMLLSAQRFFGVRREDALPALLRKSRERQANVTNALAAQVFDALDILLRGFEAASQRDRHADISTLLRRDPDHADGPQDDHLYGGLLTVLLRLVFILYAEDRELLPTSHELYARSLSLGQLFEDLQRDHDAFPDTMSRRFGAWSRLLALFRAIHDGVEHGTLHIPRRRGELFDPSRFPFLESWQPPDSPVETDLSAVGVPTIDDETVYRILERLMILEGQRLSYKVLSVEQIGSVYEALMGYGVVKLDAPAVCCGHKSLQKGSTGGVWIQAGPVLAVAPGSRSKSLVSTYNIEKSGANRIAADLKAAKDEAAVVAALDRISLRKVARRGAGRLVLQPGEERRRTSSHYTPRSLSEPIVRKALEPLLRAMSDKGEPSSHQLLSLKICDPAMGSGAFLVEACRFLADHVVAAWEREGQADKIASAKEDVVNHARRLVAQACLYGVDKNPFAVSLAKLSLWLETLAKDEPFTFVDHALRHGDSLVGLSFEQLKAFHWAPAAQMELIEKELSSCIAEALSLRQQILDLAGDSSPGVTRLKEQLLWDANDAQERLRIVGDLVIGTFFEKSKKEREVERKARLDQVRTWLTESGELPATLREAREQTRRRIPVFHWPLEFPEVFFAARSDPFDESSTSAAFLDVIVGNPPFMGQKWISGVLGDPYRDWLFSVHPGTRGTCDLCAHFFRRSEALLGAFGTVGLIGTNSISEGDTKEGGLAALLKNGFKIYCATRNLRWPGSAAVVVSIVHLARIPTHVAAPVTLDGELVPAIDSGLAARMERPAPLVLEAQGKHAFKGSMIYGTGFFIEEPEYRALIAADPRNAEKLYPCYGGHEINNDPSQRFERYVINFGDASYEEAAEWPMLLEILRERVKPERDRNRRETRRRYWWRFAETTPGLYRALQGKQQCLVTSVHAKHLIFSFCPTNAVFSNALYVLDFDDHGSFGLLQSRIHAHWAWLHSSSLGSSGIRYSASRCLDTFPYPTTMSSIEIIGCELYELRSRIMKEDNKNLTEIYNELEKPEAGVRDIDLLRTLHHRLDRVVLAAYEWSDLEPPLVGGGIHRGVHAVFGEEVVTRLYALNAERANIRRTRVAGAQ